MSAYPVIKSTLFGKHISKDVWEKYCNHKTKTSQCTLAQATVCATIFEPTCGIFPGDWDSYKDFAEVFDPVIQDYHGLSEGFMHKSDMDVSKLKGGLDLNAPIISTRIRVGRSLEGFGLSPRITKEGRLKVESLIKSACQKLEGEYAGIYHPLMKMEESVRQHLVDDHFLFRSDNPRQEFAGMKRDWPEGRGIFLNTEKTFLVWVNEEDHLRIISMQEGCDVRTVFQRLVNGLEAISKYFKAENGRGVNFMLDDKYGYIHSCPTNLGTGMRASVHINLPGWKKEGEDQLRTRCEELALQTRSAEGDAGGETGHTYDISNKRRLGYTEVQLVQTMLDGVNVLYHEDLELQTKHGLH